MPHIEGRGWVSDEELAREAAIKRSEKRRDKRTRRAARHELRMSLPAHHRRK